MIVQWLRAARVTLNANGRQITVPGEDSLDQNRITFKVENRIRPKPQPPAAEINVYNLSEETRGQFKMRDFAARNVVVLLEAGYRGLEKGAAPIYGTLFSGQVRTLDHIRNGAEWITRIQCLGGARAWKHTTTRSFGPGVTLRTVITAVATDTGLLLGNLEEALDDWLENDPPFRKGWSQHGMAVTELTKLLHAHGFVWTVQEGALLVAKKDEGLPRTAILISEETGMIGSPERGAPDRSLLVSPLKVQKALDPSITPGARLKLKSKSVDLGEFYATLILHSGDTHGDEWVTRIETRPLP